MQIVAKNFRFIVQHSRTFHKSRWTLGCSLDAHCYAFLGEVTMTSPETVTQPGTRLGYVSVRECNERPTLTDEEFLHVIKPLRRSPHQHPARHAGKPCLTMFRIEKTILRIDSYYGLLFVCIEPLIDAFSYIVMFIPSIVNRKHRLHV